MTQSLVGLIGLDVHRLILGAKHEDVYSCYSPRRQNTLQSERCQDLRKTRGFIVAGDEKVVDIISGCDGARICDALGKLN
jgi:hypothetical protein